MTMIDLPELETLTVEILDDDIGVMRINRPDRMNSYTAEMFTEHLLVARALRDSDLRALIITGAGDKSILRRIRPWTRSTSSRQWASASSSSFRRPPPAASRLCATCPFPSSPRSTVRPPAAEWRWRSPPTSGSRPRTAKFSAAFVKVGLSMGELGTSVNLAALVGPGRAAEIGYTARIVKAEEAERIGPSTGWCAETSCSPRQCPWLSRSQRNRPEESACPNGRFSATARSDPMLRHWSWRIAARHC